MNCVLRVVNFRRPILFNIVKNWNQATFILCMEGASAFGWFLVILSGAAWFWAISDYFMICTNLYDLFFNYIRTKRNTIHTSIQTRIIKLKEVCVKVSRFGKDKFKIKNKICWTKVQKKHCGVKLTTITFENPAIWHWMHCHSTLPYTTF